MTDTTPQELRALADAALDTDADPAEAFLLGFRIGQSSPVAGMEIGAAAMSLFRDDTNWADPDPSDGRVKDWWDGQTEDIRARYRLKALHALRAARNAHKEQQ